MFAFIIITWFTVLSVCTVIRLVNVKPGFTTMIEGCKEKLIDPYLNY